MKIRIEELEHCFKEIIKKLKEKNINPIELDTDYYQIIPTDQWDNFEYNETPNVGSLSDDIESLQKMINNSEIPCTYVDFDRIASILRAISQENNIPIED